jgi:citrate synthase
VRVPDAGFDIDTAINIDNTTAPSQIGIMQYRLRDVIAATTRLGSIDSEAGRLVLASHEVEEIAPNASSEEVAHLPLTVVANDSNSQARIGTLARETSSVSRASAAVCRNSPNPGDQCSRGATMPASFSPELSRSRTVCRRIPRHAFQLSDTSYCDRRSQACKHPAKTRNR